MGFLRTFTRLALECRRHKFWYRDVTANDPVLAEYNTPDAVVDALALSSAPPTGARASVVHAVVLAQHAWPSALWQGILLRSFAPLLLALRSVGPNGCGAYRDPPVLLGFSEALAQVGEGGDADRIELRLRLLIGRSRVRLLRRPPYRASDDPIVDPLESVIRAGSRPDDFLRPPADPLLRSLLDEVERAALRAIVRMRHPGAAPRQLEPVYRPERRRRRRLGPRPSPLFCRIA